MQAVKTLFRDTDGTINKLHSTAAILKYRRFNINYNVLDDKAIVLISSNNPRELLHGWIFEYPSFQPILELPRIVYNAPANLNGASFYALRDGTVVYLYYIDKWYMASSKSVSIGDTSIKGHTFWDLFHECAPGLLSQLDTSKTYSFGFTNTKIHHSMDGNAIWNNNFTEDLGVSPLKQISSVKAGESAYGTMIVFPGSKTRHIKVGQLCSDLKALKYNKKINREVEIGSYDYNKYVCLRAWLLSEKAFMRLKRIEADRIEEFEEFEKQASELLNRIQTGDHKYDFYDTSGSVLNRNRIEFVRNIHNIDIFYGILFKGFDL